MALTPSRVETSTSSSTTTNMAMQLDTVDAITVVKGGLDAFESLQMKAKENASIWLSNGYLRVISDLNVQAVLDFGRSQLLLCHRRTV